MLLTIRELASRLHIKPSTLYAWAAKGKIPHLKIHGLIRFKRDEIDEWLATLEQKTPPSSGTKKRTLRTHEVDSLIASAKREVYTARRGNQTKSSPIRKEEVDGAV